MSAATAATIAHLREALHPGAFVDDTNLRGYAVNGSTPQCVALPVTQEALAQCLSMTGELGLAVIPTGIGARIRVGAPPRRYDVSLCTRDLDRIVAHEAADMTVTVEAGCPLTTLNGTLARMGQWVPIDPPLPERTTIGGLIASDGSGPLRFSQGKVRDLLIGIKVVLADGRVVHGGGRVVKNVAGYDLMKLFTGSWGTLGVIAEATFKVRPRPTNSSLLVVETRDAVDAAQVALEVIAGPLAPLYVEVVNQTTTATLGLGSDGSAVLIGLGGAMEDITVQHERLRALAGDRCLREVERGEMARAYTALRDWPALSTTQATTRGATVCVLPTQLPQLVSRLERLPQADGSLGLVAHAGSGAVIARSSGHGDSAADRAWFSAVRDCARELGGYATFDSVPPPLAAELDPWGSDIPGLSLMHGIKASLDPQTLLSPGRFVGGI